MQTIETFAEFPLMVDIVRNAANHLIPTTYGLQYNTGWFKLENVSQLIFQIPEARLVFRVL